jgi:hypothetical protein
MKNFGWFAIGMLVLLAGCSEDRRIGDSGVDSPMDDGSVPTDGGPSSDGGVDAAVPMDSPMPMDSTVPIDAPSVDSSLPMDAAMDGGADAPMDAGTDAMPDAGPPPGPPVLGSVHRFGAAEDDHVSSVVVGADGTVFAGGSVRSGTITIGTFTLTSAGAGSNLVFFALAPSGTVRWAKRLPGPSLATREPIRRRRSRSSPTARSSPRAISPARATSATA